MSIIPIKKLSSGFSLPEIGLGTWQFGGMYERDDSRDAEWVASLRGAIEMGYTHIDVAEMYGAGHAEELVAQAMKGFDRLKLSIASKVTNIHLKFDDVLSAAEASLKRLNIDQIDLYYVHAPNPAIPIEETMRAFDKLVSEKLVKNIGVSNFSVQQLEAAQRCTKNKIVANQIEYSLLTRNVSKHGWGSRLGDMEKEMVPYCQAHEIFVVCERPVERGAVFVKNALIDSLCEKYEKTYAQIAINWLISQKNVIAIPKAEKESHQRENLGGVGWRMDPEDLERLRTGIEVDRLFKSK
jgi:diketogulonate reductase-like aldo/keto reductase